jgi:hypothetical protein
MSKRNTGIRGDTQGRGHTRDDLIRHAGFSQSLQFLAAATEDERIATLEAHDSASGKRTLDHDAADLFLRVSVLRSFLADVDAFGVRRSEVKQPRVGEVVVQDAPGKAEDTPALDSD